MITRTLVAAMALALSSGAANAGDSKMTKEKSTGLITGAVSGAIVGGPIGAFVGLMFGGILGDSVGTAKRAEQHAQQLEDELLETRLALARAGERTAGDEMFDALAQRLRADVLFRTNSVDMDSQVADQLEQLGLLLSEHSQLEVELHGFADPRGTPEQNLELSQRRADAVREVLIKGGALPQQIRLAAHGEDLATASRDDVEAHAWERRVSIAIRPNATTTVAQSR